MIWIFILCVVVAIVAIICLVSAGKSDAWEEFFNGVCFAICSLVIIVLALVMWGKPYQPSPNAIDVYRGRTTLEITYRDTVAIDSVVVFK